MSLPFVRGRRKAVRSLATGHSHLRFKIDVPDANVIERVSKRSPLQNLIRMNLFAQSDPLLTADIAETLLRKGANVSAIDDLGRTSLHYAAEGGNVAVIRLLIREGAKVTARDVFHKTPLIWPPLARRYRCCVSWMVTSCVRYLTTLASCVVVLAFTIVSARAADIRVVPRQETGFERSIAIEGEIARGDFDDFIRLIEENQGAIVDVYLFSLGGDFREAMRIGRAVRALELSSRVPMRNASGRPVCNGERGFEPQNANHCTCTSACFFIHIAASYRDGSYLAVHRPYLDPEQFARLSQGQAKEAFDRLQDSAKQCMLDMGIPNHVQEEVLGTSSDRLLVLDDKTIRTYFSGDLPYREEWTRSKCPPLTPQERERLDKHVDRLVQLRERNLRSRSEPVTPVAREDLISVVIDDGDLSLQAIQKKAWDERTCKADMDRQSRLEAHEVYFGRKPTDLRYHNFRRWAEAPRYLGKRFADLLDEERFTEDKFLSMSYLNRPATARTPYLSLYDSSDKTRVVWGVRILSGEHPSP